MSSKNENAKGSPAEDNETGDSAGGTDARDEAEKLRRQARDLGDVGELEGAEHYLEQALALFREVGDRGEQAEVQRSLGMLALARKDPNAALERFKEAFGLHLAAGDRENIAHDLGYLAHASTASKGHARAVLYVETALALHRSSGNETAILLDLAAQGEAILALVGQLPAGLACLHQAIRYGEKVEFPRLAELRLRYESIMGQLGDNFPDKAAELERAFEVEAEDIRMEGVHSLLANPELSVSFFDDQYLVASALDDAGGVFSSLGSQSQCLAEAGHVRGGVAALTLAEEALKDLPPSADKMVREALQDWRASLEDAADEKDLAALRAEVSGDAEEIRREAVSSVARR